jgi:dTDP-4-amino-4,6-dideoxygalactose transaminase
LKIPFHRPIFPNDTKDILSDSIESGWVTTGPKVQQFEEMLKEYFNVEHVICVNSCTAALHIALAAIGLTRGDRFIAPTFTFVATVEVGEYLGATPLLVDVEKNTLNIDLDVVERELEIDQGKTIKAIIPVHFGGQSVDMIRLRSLCTNYGVFILEDAAHAMETLAARESLSVLDAAAFSFYANKNITSGGEGGALATNDKILAERVRKLSLHGMSKDGWKRFASGGKWGYDISELGYKYNMTDIAASFGMEQLSHISEWNERRKWIAKKYEECFVGIPGLNCPKHLNGNVHAWHLYVVTVVPDLWNINRNQLIDLMGKSGIGTSVHYIPVHMHSYYTKKYNFEPSDYPIANYLSQNVISMPIYPRMTDEDVHYVVSTISKLWERNKK